MKLYHPTIPGNVVTVPDAAEDSWRAQGWRKTPPRFRIVGEKRPEFLAPDQPGTVVKRDK